MSPEHYASCALSLGFNWCTCHAVRDLADEPPTDGGDS